MEHNDVVITNIILFRRGVEGGLASLAPCIYGLLIVVVVCNCVYTGPIVTHSTVYQ